MSNPTSLKKQKLSMKLFAQLTNKQTGKTDSLMGKVLRNCHADLDSAEPEDRKNGSAVFMKLLNQVMPKETGPLVVNNNNNSKNLIMGKGGEEILLTLTDFMKERSQKVSALEKRQEESIIEVQSEPEKKKLPANSPVSR